MSGRSTGLWLAAVVAAGGIGWYAALQSERGPAFASEQDAYERFVNAMTLTDSLDRNETMIKLVRHLTPETLPGAVRAYKEDLIDLYNTDLRLLMWYWAQHDRDGMLAEVQTWPEVRALRMAAGEAVYWTLKQEGYDSAKALFDSIPTHQRDAALPQLVLAYLESGSTPNLVQLIETYESREERDLAAGIVVGQILHLNGEDALAKWVESLPDGGGTQSGLKAVAYRAAQSELMRRGQVEFLEKWLDRVDAEWWAKGARRAIAVNLAKRDPLQAIAWVEKLRPDQDRDTIFDETLRTFASFDRIGALEWMRAREPEPRLDAGTARIAYEFALRDPRVSLEMARRIQDPGLLENLEKSLESQWRALADDQKGKWSVELKAIVSARKPSSPAAG